MAIGEKTGGRQANTPNKLTSKTKDAIWEVFRGLGDVEAMTKWAADNKGDFYTKVWARLIPQEFHGKGFTPPPPKVTKQDSDREFARKVLYVLNAGAHERKDAELLRDAHVNEDRPN